MKWSRVSALDSGFRGTGARSFGSALKERIGVIVVGTVVATVFLSGFLNLIDFHGYYPATLLLDGLTAFMTLAVVGSFVFRRKFAIPSVWISALLVVTIVYISLSIFFGEESPYVKFLSIRTHILYAVVAIFAVTFIRTRAQAAALLTIAMRSSVVMGVFAIAQFSFRNELPTWLLVSRDTTVFSYSGTDITRSTALLGNTIVFSAIALMFFCLYLFKLVYRFSWSALVSTAILYIAVLTSFSRMSIAGAGGALLVAFLVSMFRNRSLKVFFAWCAGGLLVIAALIPEFALVTPISPTATPPASLAGSPAVPATGIPIPVSTAGPGNVTLNASTAGHLDFIHSAIHTLLSHPLVGIGIGSQEQGAVHTAAADKITDGAILIVLVEGGLILGAAYFVASLLFAWTLGKIWKRGGPLVFFSAGLTVFTIFQFGVASFFNSAIFGKNAFILYWVLFGIVVVLERVRDSGNGDSDVVRSFSDHV